MIAPINRGRIIKTTGKRVSKPPAGPAGGDGGDGRIKSAVAARIKDWDYPCADTVRRLGG
ncbi:hypothetical protein C4900_13875 [Acidiferrobacter thiooxydans]|uniref:Uncharacterized protein n=1 Tax=Acidiferrobacter thiooxydans TaxID=163359 RepID=A0A368HIG3_9GAMM|nr:hypothetical protein C4900_13875 [Acidiferrobacter thiooxydans]